MRGDPPLIGGGKVQETNYRRKAAAAASETDPPLGRMRRPRYNRRHGNVLAGVSSGLLAKVRLSRRVVLVASAFVAASAATFALYFSSPPPVPALPQVFKRSAKELVVLIRPGPVVYFPGAKGSMEGLDADLLRLFAAEKNLVLHFVAVDDVVQLYSGLANGEGQIGAGGLLRPPPGARADAVTASGTDGSKEASDKPPPNNSSLHWTVGYHIVEPVLIYNTDGFRPANWNDLDDETVAFSDSAGLDSEIASVRKDHPAVVLQPVAQPSPVELIARVSGGEISYAIVGSLAAAIARNIYLDFDVAFPIGGKRQVAWAVSGHSPRLAADLDRFIERVKRDGTLARLLERYVPELQQFQRLDASGLQERARTALPQYRQLFREAQEKTGIDWRLLAALAYQESKWDPAATSETGVRGFMQITEDTAKHLGITNLLDPGQNVLAGARYLGTLKDKLPARIQEPDRTWLALAAYNIGLGHLEDARVLAQRQGLDPDHWSNVKKVLPLLALPEHYEKAKLGYARGGMPVAFVDRVRGYYDVLLARETPLQPRLRLFADAPEASTSDKAPATAKN